VAMTGSRTGRRRAAPPPRRKAIKERRQALLRRSRERDRRGRAAARVPGTRTGPASWVLRTAWLLGVLLCVVATLQPWWDTAPVPATAVPDLDDWVARAGAVGITSLFTHGLAVRTGGRPWLGGGLALALTTAAVVSGSAVLLAGATVATAVVAGVLAVLATVPGPGFAIVVREVLVATGVAVAGAFAVHAYAADVSFARTAYLAIGLALLGALVLVWRLGAGLHGLGRRGTVMILSGVGVLSVVLAYTEALGQWGSPALIETLEGFLTRTREMLGAVPRPIEVLLGFPALAWGVSTRARRRQGWWVCAFGAPGLAIVSVSLLAPGTTLTEAGLTLGYSVLLGLVVGYAVIRADLFLTGARGRRARRLEELAAHRPEPRRMEPLL
jgi:hypothetical protein